jgi:hypothetical protein
MTTIEGATGEGAGMTTNDEPLTQKEIDMVMFDKALSGYVMAQLWTARGDLTIGDLRKSIRLMIQLDAQRVGAEQ